VIFDLPAQVKLPINDLWRPRLGFDFGRPSETFIVDFWSYLKNFKTMYKCGIDGWRRFSNNSAANGGGIY